MYRSPKSELPQATVLQMPNGKYSWRSVDIFILYSPTGVQSENLDEF